MTEARRGKAPSVPTGRLRLIHAISLGLTLLAALPLGLEAQRRGRGRGFGGDRGGYAKLQEMVESGDFSKYNISYDGRFTFVRIRFTPLEDWSGWRRGPPEWSHDYPMGEQNYMKIMREVTGLRPHVDASNILAADDPELFKFPVGYICEPGFWTATDKEAAGLRAYLQKGGFLIFDDFEGEHWFNFEEKMHQVLPGAEFVKLDPSYPIFHSFFDIDDLEPLSHDNYRSQRSGAVFYGIFEENDPKKRLMAIVNYNNDIGEDWEWSGTGFYPIELSNEGYKLGVNYLIYALTH
jgi:hypothetical protein